MIEDTDAPFVERVRRNPSKWKKNNKGDGFANKAKKHHKQRERELHEEDLDDEARDYK